MITEERRAEDTSPVSPVNNRRRDGMFMAAYIAIAVLVYVVVYEEKIGEYAQSTVSLVLGMFLNELKNMYSYETGTTRSAAKKDEAITELTKAATTTATTAQAVQVASDAAVVAAAPKPGP